MNGLQHNSLSVDNDKTYLNYDADPLIRTAITHAQFESIHPFLDGNGRLGRILIILMLVNAGVIDKPVFLLVKSSKKKRRDIMIY
ncbi:hypothetical protein Saur07_00862 [Staphylococcus aureus]